MRKTGYVAWSMAVLAVTLPARARAQDQDTLPTVEVRDSLDDEQDAWDDGDTLAVHPRVTRGRGEPNPYLREVRRERQRRGPFWVSGSFGVGGEAIAAPGSLSPWDRSRLAPTLSVGLGGSVGQNLRLGLEGFGWLNPDGDILESVTAALFTARVYPFRTAGLFLKTGFGIGRYGQDTVDDCDCSTTLVSDPGFAWMFGAGFEAPVGKGLWIGPTVDVLRMNVRGPDGYRERVVSFGIAVSFDGKD